MEVSSSPSSSCLVDPLNVTVKGQESYSLLDGPPVNPLFCPPVFLELTKFLSFADLKTCRLVCKQWQEMSSSPLASRGRIHFTCSKQVLKFKREIGRMDEVPNFRMTLNRGATDVLDTFAKQLLETGNGNGTHLRELKIDFYFILSPLFTFLFTHCSNLESLCFKFCSYNGSYSPPDKLVGPIQQLTFQKLKKFEVNQSPLSGNILFLNILYGAPHLTEISCTDRIISGWIWTMLDTWKQNLKTLRLGFVNFDKLETRLKRFPCLPRLRTLDVMYWQSLTGINNLTALEELVLQRSHLEIMFAFQNQPGPLPQPMLTVRKVRIEDSYKFGTTIQTLTYLFPQLKCLHFLAICNKSLRQACEGFQYLEELYVGQAVMDLGMTGFVSYKKLPSAVSAAMMSKHSPRLLTMRKHPFIGNLSKLTHITIASKNVTDLSVLLGLMYCTSLTSVRFERPGLSKMSLLLFANGFNLQHLHIRIKGEEVNDWLNSKELSYFQELHPHCKIQFSVHPTNPRLAPMELDI